MPPPAADRSAAGVPHSLLDGDLSPPDDWSKLKGKALAKARRKHEAATKQHAAPEELVATPAYDAYVASQRCDCS